MWQVEWAASQHLLSPFSIIIAFYYGFSFVPRVYAKPPVFMPSPCLRVQTVYNYGLWDNENPSLTDVPQSKFYPGILRPLYDTCLGLVRPLNSVIGLGISDKKCNSGEDGIDGTSGYFRQNSSCSAEQKALGILLRTLPRKRKQLRIPFRWTKIEANSRNSIPNPSAEEKTTRNPVRGTKIEANSQNSLLTSSAEEKTTKKKCSVVQK